jgi:hypothetical protein
MAATYDFTPVNGGSKTVGTLESYAQLKAFVITIKNDSNTAIDLRANDGAYGSNYELIIRELQPLLASAPNDDTGVIHVIVDGHAVDADSLQARLRALVVGLGLGTTVAGNDTTVTLGTSFVVA